VSATLVQRVVSPVDGSVFAEVALATDDQIEAALSRAVSAQRRWAATPLVERVAVCERMVQWMVDRADEIGTELTWQMGRPVAHTPGEIRRGFQERARHMCAIAPAALADVRPTSTPGTPGARRFIRHEPLGVILVLAPWNYPYLTSVNVIVPALVAGNAVVLKMSQQTPLAASRYAEAFAAAGLPPGVFEIVHADHDAVMRMIADPRISFVSFTGSVEGGRAVQRAAAGRFIGTNLELGGKDPAYVRADAPLEPTIENLVDGTYYNAGQSCCGIERIYVDRALFPRFVDGFVALAKQYRLGNPLAPDTTLGPMVRTSAAQLVHDHEREAIEKGARRLIDPRDFPAARDGTPYVAPQVLVGVDHSMRVMTEETFGPLVGIMPVESDEEAVSLMNDSRYGLTASIWTTDDDAALLIGDRVATGTWFQNRCDYLDPSLAWVGIGDSGRGCSLSSMGYDALTRPKSFHLRQVRSD
jgi:acyl-CoA reductase-like NAD-dependent aldehyde dehydrogenase